MYPSKAETRSWRAMLSMTDCIRVNDLHVASEERPRIFGVECAVDHAPRWARA